jgi:predicted TIM-barrel fold metal-dependent hydrolase
LHGIRTEHRFDIEAVRAHPDRFRAYFAINPNDPDLDAAYRRFLDNLDVFVGFKTLADYFKIPITDDAYRPFFEYGDAHRHLFLSHTWGGSRHNGIKQAEEVATRYPGMTFIAGHSFHGDWEEAARLCNDLPNLYLELTAVLDDRGPLELLLEKCGSEKILFGTDLPWFDTHHGIGTILSTPMSDDDRRNIFYRNGVRLLENQSWFRPMRKDIPG